VSAFTVHFVELQVIEGSIVTLPVDAIVNAANPTLAGGGGVDGAIHAAAGPELKAHCLLLPELRPGVRCETAQAKVTPGFRLQATYVIHTVGPVWYGGEKGEAELLARCYSAVLAEVAKLGVGSVALPAISTSAYGYPADKAAKIAVREVVSFARQRTKPLRVVFACLGVAIVRHYERALQAALRP
jgi:O-acetyl-ADP-ribose deacetylase (regulator of RNase III)